MDVKSITDSIKLLNLNLSIPVKAQSTLKLSQNEPLSSTLNYLSKAYSESIWKSSVKQSTQSRVKETCLKTNFKTSLFSTIELLYGYSVETSCYTKKYKTCPHLLSE